MKSVVMRTRLPIRYKTYYNGDPITPEEVRRRISKFLKDNLTECLALRRDEFISDQRRLRFVSPLTLALQGPSFRKSVRVSSLLDAKVSEYAGIMQITKTKVVWLAVALHDSQYPSVMPLTEVLERTGPVNRDFLDFYGNVRLPVE